MEEIATDEAALGGDSLGEADLHLGALGLREGEKYVLFNKY